jgi:uncharacterized membrane protein
MPIRVLLAGESWVTNSSHYKGWDFYSSAAYETGVKDLQTVLKSGGMEFTHMPSHLAAEEFPSTMESLSNYDVVLLSDIGSNTLLLPSDVFVLGKTSPNRLILLKDWVNQGGALGMCGGYLSFSGLQATAKYFRTPVEEILPVRIHTFDDRVEAPQGVQPVIVDPNHPIIAGITGTWPVLLGFNELEIKPEAHLIAQVDDYPLLAVRQVGKGRTLAWASDIGPHWCPESFTRWDGYARLWIQAIEWLVGSR